MNQIGVFPGRRLSLSPSPSPSDPDVISACWVSSSGRRLQLATLPAGGGASTLASLQEPGGRQFVQPVVQGLGGGRLAVAWAGGNTADARVRVAVLNLQRDGSTRLLARFRSGKGEGEPDLSLTPSGGLVLATSRRDGALLVRQLKPDDLSASAPLLIRSGRSQDPQLAPLARQGLAAALLFRTDRGLRLALLEVDRSGVRLERQLTISGSSADQGPAISSDGGGRLVMAWAQPDPARQGSNDVMVRSYSVEADRLGASRRAHGDPTGEQRDPMLAIERGGDVRLVWRDSRQGRLGVATSLLREGTAGEWRILAESVLGEGLDPDVATAAGGAPVVGWTSTSGKTDAVVLARLQGGGNRSKLRPRRQRHEIRASLNRDRLRGTGGADVFVFPTRSHSLLGRHDVISGYRSNDVIDDHHARRFVTVDPITAPAGRIRRLTSGELNRVCTRTNGFGTYGAVAFTVKGEPGVWLAINDSRSGFQTNSDPVLHLNDFTPSLRAPITLV